MQILVTYDFHEVKINKEFYQIIEDRMSDYQYNFFLIFFSPLCVETRADSFGGSRHVFFSAYAFSGLCTGILLCLFLFAKLSVGCPSQLVSLSLLPSE